MAKYLIRIGPKPNRKVFEQKKYGVVFFYRWEEGEDIFSDIIENFREVFYEEYTFGLSTRCIFGEQWLTMADEFEAKLDEKIEFWREQGFDVFKEMIKAEGYLIVSYILDVDQLISMAEDEMFSGEGDMLEI